MQSAAYAGLIVHITPSASCIAVRRSYSTRSNKMRESTSSMHTGFQAAGCSFSYYYYYYNYYYYNYYYYYWPRQSPLTESICSSAFSLEPS